MYVTKTWFTQDKRRGYTWKQPGDIGRYQTAYIMTKIGSARALEMQNTIQVCSSAVYSLVPGSVGTEKNLKILLLESLCSTVVHNTVVRAVPK